MLQGDLRIAHCGGYHSDFDTLIKAINVIAKLLHLDIRWVWSGLKQLSLLGTASGCQACCWTFDSMFESGPAQEVANKLQGST